MSTDRTDLQAIAEGISNRVNELIERLQRAAAGDGETASEIRFAANQLALDATQAELTAAKGAGFVTGHPAGQRCQQALFFLVWSCPPAVTQGHLCGWSQTADAS